jgi:hypothetical protein
MSKMNEVTINDIAFAHELHPVYVGKMIRAKNGLKPVRKIGPTNLYDAKAAARFMANRPQKPGRPKGK